MVAQRKGLDANINLCVNSLFVEKIKGLMLDIFIAIIVTHNSTEYWYFAASPNSFKMFANEYIQFLFRTVTFKL